jgi:hypothetical protein
MIPIEFIAQMIIRLPGDLFYQAYYDRVSLGKVGIILNILANPQGTTKGPPRANIEQH